jgi:TonB family protein
MTGGTRNSGFTRPAPRIAARLLAAVPFLALGVRAAAAQDNSFDPRAPDTGIVVHWMTVATPTARFTFERVTGRAVVLSVRTDSGTFTAVRDSAIIAALADSVAAAPAPAAAAGNEPVSFKYWELRAPGDSSAHMRFARVPTQDGAEVIVAVSNGAWGAVVHPGLQTAAVLAGFRGDTVTTGGAAQVSYRTTRVWPRPNQCGAEDSARVATTPLMGPTCGHMAKHISRLSPAPPTVYPPDLLRAHISGSVLLAFEVDTTGRADMSSVVLYKRSPEPAFARACRDRVRRMTFSPAEIDGRKVAEFTALPRDFVIRR